MVKVVACPSQETPQLERNPPMTASFAGCCSIINYISYTYTHTHIIYYIHIKYINTYVNFKVLAGPLPFDCQGIRAIRNMPDLAQGPNNQEAVEKGLRVW